jgi:hypothetical protein
VVSGDFDKRADKSHGYLPYGVAWYRRRLCLQDAVAISDGSKHSWLEFDGVMVKSKALEGLRKYAEIRVGKAAVCGYSNFSQSESIRECGS